MHDQSIYAQLVTRAELCIQSEDVQAKRVVTTRQHSVVGRHGGGKQGQLAVQVACSWQCPFHPTHQTGDLGGCCGRHLPWDCLAGGCCHQGKISGGRLPGRFPWGCRPWFLQQARSNTEPFAPAGCLNCRSARVATYCPIAAAVVTAVQMAAQSAQREAVEAM